MGNVGRSKLSRVRNLLAGLRSLTESLPSEEERANITKSLSELSAYLQRVQQDVLTIPVREDVQSLLETVNKLDLVLQQAETNPITARALGLEKPAKRHARATSPPIDPRRVDELLKKFDSMTIDQIREILRDDEVCSTSELRALANAVGLTTQSRMGRDALAQKFLTNLANARGYKSLSERQE